MAEPAYTPEHEAHADIALADETVRLSEVRPIPRISIQAFCETQSVAGPIERMSEDRRLAKAQCRTYMGGIQAAVEFYQSAPTPNLMILESRQPPERLLQELSQLAEVCDPSSRVVIIGHQNDVTLYRELIRSGISEYMVAPIAIADLMSVVSSLFVDPEAAPIGRSIAFIGAKGGVGASTIAHNIAWTISTVFQGETVVADMDLAFGTANINFDQDPPQGIAEAVYSPDRIDEVYLDRLLASCAQNLSLLAAPSMLDRTYDFDSESFAHMIDVAQRTAPNVILDVPHTWNSWTQTTLTRADEVVIIAEPELANLRNAKNLVDTLSKLRPNDADPKLVINKFEMPKRAEISLNDFIEPLGIQPAAVIPFEPHLFGIAANNGRMIAESEPSHEVASTFSELAHIVTGRAVVSARPKNGLKALLAKLKNM